MDIRDLLDGAAGRGGNAPRQRPLPEAQLMELRAFAERVSGPCPYRVGDVVTARSNAPYPYAGEPHLVMDLRPREAAPAHVFVERHCGTVTVTFTPPDMRVAYVDEDGDVMNAWVESAHYEPWDGPQP